MSRGQIQTRPDRPLPYRARYRGPDGRERSKSFAKRKHAEQWLTRELAKLDRGEWTDPSLARATFGEWLERYVETQRHLALSTRALRDSLISNHISPIFELRPLSSIGHSDIQAFISTMEAKGLSRSTIRQAYLIVSGVFESAVDEGAIPRNPCRSRKVKLPKQPQNEMRFLTTEQISELVAAMDTRYRTLVLTAAGTGLRFGEIAGLQKRDLDLLRGLLTVNRSVTDVQGHVQISPPKTEASRRTINLPRFLVADLARHLTENPPGPNDAVFVDPEGGLIRRRNWRRRFWLPAVQDSVGEPLRFHDLRHSHTAALIAQGEHPKTIQARLGHSSIKTTLDTYGHLFPSLDEAAAERLDETWSQALAAPPRPRATEATVTELPQTGENPR